MPFLRGLAIPGIPTVLDGLYFSNIAYVRVYQFLRVFGWCLNRDPKSMVIKVI
jgi:hypothetical protein